MSRFLLICGGFILVVLIGGFFWQLSKLQQGQIELQEGQQFLLEELKELKERNQMWMDNDNREEKDRWRQQRDWWEVELAKMTAFQKKMLETKKEEGKKGVELTKREKPQIVITSLGDVGGYWPGWAAKMTESQLPRGCDVNCKYLLGEQHIVKADAVLQFCIEARPRKIQGKLSVLQCTEPFIQPDGSLMYQPGVTAKDFDIYMGFDINSTLPITFSVWPTDLTNFCDVNDWIKVIKVVKSSMLAKHPACFFAANCNSPRTKYVEEMMKYIKVDFILVIHKHGENLEKQIA